MLPHEPLQIEPRVYSLLRVRPVLASRLHQFNSQQKVIFRGFYQPMQFEKLCAPVMKSVVKQHCIALLFLVVILVNQ
jgi:hypothetical protein